MLPGTAPGPVFTLRVLKERVIEPLDGFGLLIAVIFEDGLDDWPYVWLVLERQEKLGEDQQLGVLLAVVEGNDRDAVAELQAVGVESVVDENEVA